MVAPNGSSGDAPPPDGSGNPMGDAFPLADGGLHEGGARGGDASDAGSPAELDAISSLDAADASARTIDAGRPASDAESPVDAVAPSADAAPPAQDAASIADAGHDAGHVKQYPANVDCTSVDVGDCNSTIGFADDPGCGDTGTLVQCGTSTTRDNGGNGGGNGSDEASKKESCVILLQVTAVQTCL